MPQMDQWDKLQKQMKCIEGETVAGAKYRARVAEDASAEALEALEQVADAALARLKQAVSERGSLPVDGEAAGE